MWVGFWRSGKSYDVGQVVLFENNVYMCKEYTTYRPSYNDIPAYGWVLISRFEPHKIDHPWTPESVSVPIKGTFEFTDKVKLTDPAWLCGECWKTGNFQNAFKASDHLYVIEEFP